MEIAALPEPALYPTLYPIRTPTARRFVLGAALVLAGLTLTLQVRAQSPAQTPTTPDQNAAQQQPAQQNTTNPAPDKDQSGKDDKSASKPASAGEAAAGTSLRLGPLDPSTPPTNVPKDRPVIGLALGGGGAEAMTEIGVLQWFEEHRIPVDVIAGTSMGSIVAAL